MIEAVESYEDFLKLEFVWNGVLAKANVDFPFLTFEWISCWWKSFGEGSKLLIILVREADEIIGIAPLMKTTIKHRGVPVKAITFIANHHSNRSGLILISNKKEMIRLMLEYIFNSNEDFALLWLDFIESNSETDRILKEALISKQIKYTRLTSYQSPYIPVREEWNEYLKGRSKNFRHKINRIRNAFNRHDSYVIKQFSNDGISGAVKDVLTISEKTWKFKTKTAISSKRETVNFYSLLANIASLKGWLKIWILELNKKPIAFAYNLEYLNKTFSLKIGYDEEYAQIAPSEFLFFFAIKNSFDNNLKEYDWLGENLPFKMKWTSLCREHCRYLIYNNNVLGNFLCILELKIVPIFKRLFNYGLRK